MAYGDAMVPLAHGYTNTTLGNDHAVVKRYQGPDAELRRQREHAMLARLPAHLPVPRLLDAAPGDGADDGGGGDGGAGGAVRMSRLSGAHGQDLIDQGHAAAVLRGCGQVLRQIHAVDVATVFPAAHPAETVVVHGDFGPNNLLFDPATFAVTAAMDWEWAHPGRLIEDLAWCEWIVRMHHRDHVDALGSLFDAYGQQPSWQERQDAMVARCQSLLEWCRRWSVDSASEWHRRLAATAAWVE